MLYMPVAAIINTSGLEVLVPINPILAPDEPSLVPVWDYWQHSTVATVSSSPLGSIISS